MKDCTTKDTHALLLIGNCQSLVQGVLGIERYLLESLRLNADRVRTIYCAYLTNEQILGEIASVFERAKSENNPAVALVYSGHGNKGAFGPNGNDISYDNISLVMDQGIDFMVINHSCYSGSMIDSFKKARLLPRKGLVIASAPNNQTAGASDAFFHGILESYKARKPFRNVKVTVTEKLIVDFRDEKKGEPAVSLTDTDDCGHIDYLGYKERLIKYKRPHIITTLRAYRCGKTLDYILYSL